MTEPTVRTEDRPHYRQKMPLTWWTQRPTYVLFVLREVSCLAVAWLVVFLLLLVRALGEGPAEYQDFLDWADHPAVVTVNLVAFAFLVLHTVTWFNAAPAAMVVKFRGERLPPHKVIAPNYLACIAVSAFVAWLVLEA